MHCSPKRLRADMSFSITELPAFFRRFDTKPFSTGPYTPWPNTAEAAVRVVNATLFDLRAQLGSAPELKQITVRELLRKPSAVRNSMVTDGGNTPMEWVFGRKPRDVATIIKLVSRATDDSGDNP